MDLSPAMYLSFAREKCKPIMESQKAKKEYPPRTQQVIILDLWQYIVESKPVFEIINIDIPATHALLQNLNVQIQLEQVKLTQMFWESKSFLFN